MINKDNLLQQARKLEEYRSKNQDLIIFDGRTKGNYLGTRLDELYEFLLETDPSGLALGLMLAEMTEATIIGSQIDLHRVLREEGFVSRLNDVLSIERSIGAEVDEPRARLIERLTASLSAISDGFGTPDNREVAICLRDALYCIHTGLTLRWLTLDKDAPAAPSHLPLAIDVTHWPDLPAFLDALRTELPMGAHLARVNKTDTVIGLKSPGRSAYLSSLAISNGRMREERANSYHMAEQFDLDTAIERYPEWLPPKKPFHAHDNPYPQSVAESPINAITDLTRDRLLWLAMVVEMGVQRMAGVSDDVELVESLIRSKPETISLLSAPEVETGRELAVISPNWRFELPSVRMLFDGLLFSRWEQAFLAPALDGLTVDMLYQVRSENYALNFETKEVTPWVEEGLRFSMDRDNFAMRHAYLSGVSPYLAGTRDEVVSAQIATLERNLAAYLIGWGNRKFGRLYDEWVGSFKTAVGANVVSAVRLGVAKILPVDHASRRSGCDVLALYSQKTGRKTFQPMCFINPKKEPKWVAVISPRSSLDILAMMGKPDESALPGFLRGWSRSMSWATLDSRARVRMPSFGDGPTIHEADFFRNPPSDDVWCFAGGEVGDRVVRDRMFQVEVYLSDEHRPPAAKA